MIRVLQFADVINRHDFIDTIVQKADPTRFLVGVCVRTPRSNIAEPVYAEHTPRWILPGLSRRHVPQIAYQLARLLRSWRADILHTHHYDQAGIGWLATRLSSPTRLVIGRHYSDAIYRSSHGLKRHALLAIEQFANRSAARIVVPSMSIEEILTQRQHIDPAKVDRVPYGFVPDKYVVPDPEQVAKLRGELDLAGRFVLGNFARLHEEKGQRYLIDAVATLRDRLPDLRLLLVGEGPERAALESQIEERDLRDRVRLLGWRQDAVPLMALVDAIVQPTLQEAFSQVMAEALWMGKALVITDVSGAPDVIRDGKNGLLVPKADSAALAGAIEKLATDPALRSRLGQTGQKYVRQHLSIDKIIPLYERVYERAMEGR